LARWFVEDLYGFGQPPSRDLFGEALGHWINEMIDDVSYTSASGLANITNGIFDTVGAQHPSHAFAVAEFQPTIRTGIAWSVHVALLAILLALRAPEAGIGPEVFAAHARMRAELGLAEGEGTLARLEIGGNEYWGINAHGQAVEPLRVNAISATHAEADAFAQAARAGESGGIARLVVDRELCPACGTFGGVRSMARQLGIRVLQVVTPEGASLIIP
jgi:hypothetical protein